MLLQKGNRKLSRKILNWSITPIASCLNCSQCAKLCYARIPYLRYPCVKTSWDRNFALAQSGEFKQLIIDELVKSKRSLVRIHVAGDFFSQVYLDQWQEIIEMFPEKTFYGYSKVFHLFDFSKINALPNANIINSIAFDGIVNFGKMDRIDFLVNNGYTLCPATIEPHTWHCGENCSICMQTKNVCFKYHR